MVDNYWLMGIFGLCGLLLEIYYDCGFEFGFVGGFIVSEDCYFEVWNLVFMQNECGEGIIKEDYQIFGLLFCKNIDIGMGVEWIVLVL